MMYLSIDLRAKSIYISRVRLHKLCTVRVRTNVTRSVTLTNQRAEDSYDWDGWNGTP